MDKEEIKNEFITCIEGSHTLNLAISVLEDREELRQYCKDASLEISNMQHTIDNLQQETQQLKDRINKAIEYMKPRFMNCIGNDKRYFEDNDIQEIYEILKEDNKEKVDE